MKANGLNHQKKFWVLCVCLLLLSIASYQMSFSKTIEAQSYYSELIGKHERIVGLNKELTKYRQLTGGLSGDFVNSTKGSGDFNHILLDKVGRFCEERRLVLVEFSEPLKGIEKGYSIETGVITVEGDFKPLLELLNGLQNDFKMGRVVAADFEKEMDYRKNREQLFAKIYVQKISRDEGI